MRYFHSCVLEFCISERGLGSLWPSRHFPSIRDLIPTFVHLFWFSCSDSQTLYWNYTSMPSDSTDDLYTFPTGINFNVTHCNKIFIKTMCVAQFPRLPLLLQHQRLVSPYSNLRRSHIPPPNTNLHQRRHYIPLYQRRTIQANHGYNYGSPPDRPSEPT